MKWSADILGQSTEAPSVLSLHGIPHSDAADASFPSRNTTFLIDLEHFR